MSFEAAKSIAEKVDDNVFLGEDSKAGEKSKVITTMYLDALTTILFVEEQATLILFDYYFLPHQQRGSEYSAEKCDAIFSSAKADISYAYGLPTKNEVEGDTRKTIWNTKKYQIRLLEYLDKGYRPDIAKPICGGVNAFVFHGDEKKFMAFQKKADQSKPLRRIDKHNSAGTTK